MLPTSILIKKTIQDKYLLVCSYQLTGDSKQRYYTWPYNDTETRRHRGNICLTYHGDLVKFNLVDTAHLFVIERGLCVHSCLKMSDSDLEFTLRNFFINFVLQKIIPLLLLIYLSNNIYLSNHIFVKLFFFFKKIIKTSNYYLI